MFTHHIVDILLRNIVGNATWPHSRLYWWVLVNVEGDDAGILQNLNAPILPIFFGLDSEKALIFLKHLDESILLPKVSLRYPIHNTNLIPELDKQDEHR